MDYLSVEEATSAVYSELEIFTGWKFLKSQRCLKKKVGEVEFVINFFTSKWMFNPTNLRFIVDNNLIE